MRPITDTVQAPGIPSEPVVVDPRLAGSPLAKTALEAGLDPETIAVYLLGLKAYLAGINEEKLS